MHTKYCAHTNCKHPIKQQTQSAKTIDCHYVGCKKKKISYPFVLRRGFISRCKSSNAYLFSEINI